MRLRFKIGIFLVLVLTLTLIISNNTKSSYGEELSPELQNKIEDSIVFFVDSPVAIAYNAKIKIDGANGGVFPYIKNDRTLVPVRFLCEKLNAKVDWNEQLKEITIIKDKKVIKLVIGSNKMTIDNKEILLEAAPEMSNGRTFVPLRAIAESLDKKIFWDNGLIVVGEDEKVFNTDKDKLLIDELKYNVNALPSVDSYDNLLNLMSKYQDTGNYRNDIGMYNAKKEIQTMDAAVNNSAAKADYSKTNVQVEGVDEADVVKTDGEYIYQVNGQKINIIKAYPSNEMKITKVIDYINSEFSPQEIYVDNKYLTVIGTQYNTQTVKPLQNSQKIAAPNYYYNTRNTVKAIIYDISNKEDIKQIREVEIDGNYVSSRKIDSNIYLISNKYVNYYTIYQKEGDVTPVYKDTAVSNNYKSVDYKDIYYCPRVPEPNYMIVGGFNLNENKPLDVFTYLGAGENIYASTENLFVTTTEYKYDNRILYNNSKAIIAPQYNENKTSIYKFELKDGKTTYIAKGEVPGRILNQFSMDENNSYFRITTTTGELLSSTNISKNHLFVLDKVMSIVGKIEDLAPGEKIYSTRFMGNRAYMVTFKKVDPLFVIDLTNPSAPKVLGKLKIPGYSDYLHPYDENHIIGFGKDTIELSQNELQENYSTRAYYMGMKLAMFDVSDVNNPKEMFKENIGDRGTYSELLENHKALLFSKEKNLLAFPVTVMKLDSKNIVSQYGFPEYGKFAYQGAYIYKVDLNTGFTLRGGITHLSNEDLIKAGDYGYYGDKEVERILYINDNLYTISKSILKANDINTLIEKGELNLQ